MFTGSIPPVEAALGGSRARTGCRGARSWSRLTVVFSAVYNLHGGTARYSAKLGGKIRRIYFAFFASHSFFADESRFCEIVYKCHFGSLTWRAIRVFPPPVQLTGSSGENKQVEPRKIGSRSDIEVVER